ncbi:GATA transcription factor 8-like [Dorcoceras hygrometricum]|uniref:GATA transcription factor 8-like n=1 Tax=Dorcoceras hygrometricum TaxID=472368 RepID=A0A2Z7CL97_9LAMI|nr:GATA transcription factor 8-like [Dorcoceras hygrometricum]
MVRGKVGHVTTVWTWGWSNRKGSGIGVRRMENEREDQQNLLDLGVVRLEGLWQWWPEQGERTQKAESVRGNGCLGVCFGLGLFLENWFGLAGSVGPDRLFTVDCGRYRQSGPRPDTRLLRHPALEGVTRSAQTDSPRRIGRKQFSGEEEAAAAAARGGGRGGAHFRVRKV